MRPKTITAYILMALCALTAPAQRPANTEGLPLIDGAWTNDRDKFSFVILGDKTSGGEGKWPIYDRAVDTINLLDPDFVITVGDMIPGHMDTRAPWDAEWAEYMEHAKRIDAPLFFTVGNHDVANLETYAWWQEDFGRTYYSFDYKGCHFIAFNTEEERIDGRGPAWQAMMDWVRQDLAASADARHTFIFFHKPMWDDPRFEDVWAEIEGRLGDRKFTAVAGHEHYHATTFRKGNALVIQSATGGGIRLSPAKKWGAFHSFGFVTVEGDETTYAVVEPEGGIWPVDVAPLEFRKAVTHELVQGDVAPGADYGQAVVRLDGRVTLHNTLDQPVTIDVALENLEATGWEVAENPDWSWQDGALRCSRALAVGERLDLALPLAVPRERLSFPPNLGWRVQYEGAWLEKEAMRMVEVNTMPIYPVERYITPEEVQLVGPFKLGPIDTAPLPHAPEKANGRFFHRFGPEAGFDPNATYDGGLRWQRVQPLGVGLVNGNSLLGTLDHVAAYVACNVFSPVDQITHAVVTADNFSQTFVNGSLVRDGQDFGAPGDFVYPRLDLKQGWNTVVVKLINNRADWFLRLLIADPMGNLKLTANTPTE